MPHSKDIIMSRHSFRKPSAYFLLCFAVATIGGCSGRSFTDILANPTPQEAAVLNAPPLIIPPDFLERPLREPPAWKQDTQRSVQQAGTRNQGSSSAVPRSLTKLPAPNTRDGNSSTNQTRGAPPPLNR